MTSDPDPEEAPPRVKLAIPPGDLRTRLLEALGETDVVVRPFVRGQGLEAALDDEAADVIVVRRAQLQGHARPNFDLMDAEGDGPSVIVISEGEEPVDRSELLADGAANVLDGADGAARLAQSIETIAEAEQGGGAGGPEGRDPDAEPRLADFLSRSGYMRDFLKLVRQIAPSDSTLLITGETGVGKERLARAIHAESRRSDRPFVAVNCGALSPELLESELFGHLRGAFTGADRDRVGVIEAADGGTLFLDEIGEMPPALQVKLLTVLQRRVVVPVGGIEPRSVDVRVVGATHRDVRGQVRDGRFREDLYYRLAVIPLEVPSLRERAEDIPDLVGRLIRYFRESLPSSAVARVSEDALAVMMGYAWPGNVRELINVVERGMLLSTGAELERSALPSHLLDGGEPLVLTSAAEPAPTDLSMTLKEVREGAIDAAESAYLREVLRMEKGVIQAAAARAGVSPRALYDRLKRYDIDKSEYR